MLPEHVVLVDENDNEIGTQEKITAHRCGELHRAFSIFVLTAAAHCYFNVARRISIMPDGSGTNTVCSHPRPGEGLDTAVHRRLMEEMSFDCELRKAFHFMYKVSFENGLTEYELDHVFVGRYESDPKPNPEEADAFRWVSLDALVQDVKSKPEQYTPWLGIILSDYLGKLQSALEQAKD